MSIRTTSGWCSQREIDAPPPSAAPPRPRSARRSRESPRAPRRRGAGRRRSATRTWSAPYRSTVLRRWTRTKLALKIHDHLLTGDNRLKQGVSAEKIRASYEQALALAREHGLEESVRPLVEIRLADLERLAGGSPPPAPPAPDVVQRRAAARAASFGAGTRRLSRARGDSSSPSSGSTSTPAPAARTPAARRRVVATTEQPHAIPSRSACPNGSTSAGPQTTPPHQPAGYVVVGQSARHVDAGSRPATAARSGPSPTNVKEPRPSRANASARRTTFLRSVSDPRARTRAGRAAPQARRRESGRGPLPSRRLPSSRAPRAAFLQLTSQVGRDRDHRRRTLDDAPRQPTDAREGPMLRTSRPCAVTTSGAFTCAANNPDGTRKCAHTTSGSAAARTAGATRGSGACLRPGGRAPRDRRRAARGGCAPAARRRAEIRVSRSRDTSARRRGSSRRAAGEPRHAAPALAGDGGIEPEEHEVGHEVQKDDPVAANSVTARITGRS